MKYQISIKAIVLGVATDVVGSIIIAFLVAFAAAAAHRSVYSVVGTSSPIAFLACVTASGLALTFVGGFVAGRVSPWRKMFHGSIVGIIALVIDLLERNSPEPHWSRAATLLLAVPAGMLGGAIAARKGTPEAIGNELGK